MWGSFGKPFWPIDKIVFFCYNGRMQIDVLQQLVIALVLAALIGLEREHVVKKDKAVRFAGIRTFGLIGLLGALSQILAEYSQVLSYIFVAGMILFIVAAYVMSSFISKTGGATTEIAAVLAFVNGILCAHEKYILATAVTLAVLFILHFRAKLHKIAEGVSRQEIVSTIEFMLIAFIVLPLLPNEYYGPFDVFNPYIIWLMVVLISGISFVSYIAIKVIGAKRGIGLIGFLSGLVSSTALAMSFSQQSKQNKDVVNPYVFAVTIGTSAVFVRILLEVFVINRDLVFPLLVPLLAMGMTGILCAIFFWTRHGEERKKLAEETVKMESPFQLRPALKFAFFFAFVLFLTKVMEVYFGVKGVYITSVIAGFADVDPITVSVANLAKGDLSKEAAVTAITIASMMNLIGKASIFAIFGGRKVAKSVALVFAIMLCAGAISLLFI